MGTGAGLGASSFLGTGTRGAASLEVRTSSPDGSACRNSVLKVPEAGSKTNSVEKLGPTGVGALGSSSKVMAGLFKVKS